MNRPDFKHMCFLHMQQLTNFPFIEDDFDSLTNYGLLCKIVEYLNKVIANDNTQNETITALYNAFVELKDYVDNLDLQDEVNNKLDEYVEDGTLEHIIASYLQTQKIYNTHTEMIADSENLVDDLTVQTLGYYAINDGGGSFYKITDTESATEYQEEIGNLYATLIDSGTVYPEQFGAYGDETHDDSAAVQLAINYGSNKNIPVELTKKYQLKNIVTLKNNLTISGKGSLIFDIDDFDFDESIFCVKTENFDDYTLSLNQFNQNITIKDITIEGKGGTSTIYNIFGISNTINFTFDNVHILLDEGGRFEPFDFRGGNLNTKIENCLIEDLQKNSKPNPAGGCIFRQYNADYHSTIRISNSHFIKKNGDEVIFVSITNNVDQFIVENCLIEIGRGDELTKTPDNCLTLITNNGGIANIIYQNCVIDANTFNSHLFIKTNNDSNNISTVTCKDSKIKTSSNATGMLSSGVNFENCDIIIGNSVPAYTPQITKANVNNCKIEILVNQSYSIFQNIEYVKNSIIIGNSKTCTMLCSNVRKFINNFVDGVSFTNCFVDVQKIFNNQIYRYNEASEYNNILFFNNVTDCVCKNNYFDFWSVVEVKTGVTVWFTGNESAIRFSLTNNGTFKNCNNVGDQGFVGTGWNESGNNIVL